MSAQSEPKSWSAVLALKRILVPTDFSEESKKAFGYAAALAEEFNASVTVLFVLEIVPFIVGLEAIPMAVDTATVLASSRARLDGWIKAELPSTIRVTPLVQEGRAFSEIVRVAQTNDIDLIVLSTHGHSALKHLFMGSTAERVIRHAPCPVLAVRAKEQVRPFPETTRKGKLERKFNRTRLTRRKGI